MTHGEIEHALRRLARDVAYLHDAIEAEGNAPPSWSVDALRQAREALERSEPAEADSRTPQP